MGEVGSFGGIQFYVRSINGKNQILSFQNMSRESSSKYEEHQVTGKKAYLEFIAPDPDQITLTIIADEKFGIAPRKLQKKLHVYEAQGKVCTFMLGGKRVGHFKWVITKTSDAYNTIGVNGRVTQMSFVLTLKEYRYKKKKSATYVSLVKNGSSTKNSTKSSTKDYEPKAKSYEMYTIQKGDTLWGIAKKYYGDANGSKYTKIYNANKDIIKNPNKLTIGWKIKIPK